MAVSAVQRVLREHVHRGQVDGRGTAQGDVLRDPGRALRAVQADQDGKPYDALRVRGQLPDHGQAGRCPAAVRSDREGGAFASDGRAGGAAQVDRPECVR